MCDLRRICLSSVSRGQQACTLDPRFGKVGRLPPKMVPGLFLGLHLRGPWLPRGRLWDATGKWAIHSLLGPFLFWPLQPASPPPPINAFSIAAPGALLMEFLTRGFGGFGSIHTKNARCHGRSRAGLTYICRYGSPGLFSPPLGLPVTHCGVCMILNGLLVPEDLGVEQERFQGLP